MSFWIPACYAPLSLRSLILHLAWRSLFTVSLEKLMIYFSAITLYTRKNAVVGLLQISSVQSHSRVWLFATHGLQHAMPPCPSSTPGVYPNSSPLNWWCSPTVSSSVVPFSSCPQSFPASGSFPMSQLFISGGQNIVVSASTSVLPMNPQNWSPLGWTGWISLQSKGLSRAFSNTTVQKHQFFGTQLSL